MGTAQKTVHHSDGVLRLGVVVPSVNTVVEPWFSAVMPAGVSVHAARMLMDNVLTPEAIVRMDREQGAPAVRQLMSCRPRALAYCCTASSIVQGLDYDRSLQREISDNAGVPSTTATQAILAALRVLGIDAVAAASPYAEDIDGAEHAFFASAGVQVRSSACLGIRDGFELARPSAAEIAALARRAYAPRGASPAHNLFEPLVAPRHRAVGARSRHPGNHVDPGDPLAIAADRWIEDRIPGYGRLLAEH